MKKTLLIGNFGAGNIGDELILTASLKKYPNATVITANAQKSQTFTEQSFQTIKPFPTGIRSTLKYLKNKPKHPSFDRIVFAGGGLFAIKAKAYWIWTLTAIFAKYYWPKAEILWEGQSFDAKKNPLKRFFVKKALKNANKIEVRDPSSQIFLKSMGITAQKTEDTAYVWAKQAYKNQNTEKKSQKRPLLLLNARATVKKAQWEQIIAQNAHLQPVFVAHTPSDLAFAPKNIKNCKKVLPQTAAQVISLYSQAETAIGERLHFLYMAQACQIPNFSVLRNAYAQKVQIFKKKEKTALKKGKKITKKD